MWFATAQSQVGRGTSLKRLTSFVVAPCAPRPTRRRTCQFLEVKLPLSIPSDADPLQRHRDGPSEAVPTMGLRQHREQLLLKWYQCLTTVRSTHRSLTNVQTRRCEVRHYPKDARTSEHVGPKCLHWLLHADGIAVTASERTMGLPAVVLQSLQTATTQPSVYAGRAAGAWQASCRAVQRCRGCLERLRCS